MSLDNLAVVQTRVEFEPPAPPGPSSPVGSYDTTNVQAPWFSYADIEGVLDPNIEVRDQIEVLRIFDQIVDNHIELTINDRRSMFVIPKSHITVDTALKRITLDLTASSMTYLTDGGDMVTIPTFTAGSDKVVIKRKTISTRSLVVFKPGRLSYTQMNASLGQLLRLVQEIQDELKNDFIRKDDQYSDTGPFLGGEDINMRGMGIKQLGYPGSIQDGASKEFVLDKIRQFGALAKDTTPPSINSDQTSNPFYDEASADYSPSPIWFNPADGGLYIYVTSAAGTNAVQINGPGHSDESRFCIGKLDGTGSFMSSMASIPAFTSGNLATEGTWFITIINPTTGAATYDAAVTTSHAFTGVANAAFVAVRIDGG